MTMTESFIDIVRRALAATPIARKLATHGAVVLERVARGGGATNWFRCTDEESLDTIAGRLLPGSVVSFYFDDRLRALDTIEGARSRGGELLATVAEIVVGALADDGVAIEVDFPSSMREVNEFLDEHVGARLFFAGQFSGRDNDDVRAVTVTIPDLDGVVRAHPH